MALSQSKLHAKGMLLCKFKDFEGDNDKGNKRTKQSNRTLRHQLKADDNKRLNQEDWDSCQ